ncbi:hypothetical protein HY230_04055 [Candidatus Acetothermia bacterium]|nr:hypothetical protein [Candidatus Acetothermia bacterium]
MFKNTIALPLIALALALAGAAALAFDLNLKEQAKQAQPLVVDGKIGESEYQNHLRVDGIQMDLYWSIQGDRIYVGLHAPGRGWVAIGFDPEGPIMQGADIVIGYVKDGKLFLQDSYANVPTGHQADTELGGRDDILEKAGSQSADGTVLEFSRKLDTGDKFDKPIRDGKPMAILMAYAEDADFTSYHSRTRARVQSVDFFQANSKANETPPLWVASHLEAYELGLVAWIIVLGIFAIQGFISVRLEGRELIPGHFVPARESTISVVFTALLTVLELVWAVQFIASLYEGARPAVVATYGALLAFTLAAILLVYRQSFVSAETIVQEREDHIPW